VCPRDELAAWQRWFLDAAVAEGFPRLSDADASPGAHGVAPFVQNVKGGVRWNAAFTFLDPVRTRVTVIDGVLADRLVLEGNRARALIAHGPDGPREIHAERFLLCAGVYGSPAILMRSGVGPAEHLRTLGIPVQAALRGVGANLHDHPGVGFEYEPTARARRAARDDESSRRFQESQVVLRAAPELHVVPYQTHDEGEWAFGILVYCMSPRSRGRVRLTSRDPAAAPSIEPSLLTDRGKRDLDALIDGVDLVHRLTRQAPLADAIRRGPRRFAARSRRARFVGDNVTDYSHPVGTCRMGPSPRRGDVVDPRGRVHGLANVFVADASVVPRIPRANVNLTCYVIGTRVADLL
jgi:choline dehydrogenase